MKYLTKLLFSNITTLVLLLILATGLGFATFIEEKHDTLTAQLLVYKALWMEILLLLLAVNFIGNIGRYNLYNRKKLAGLMFHLAFVVMILGAALTRYLGFEGNMHIREGESSDFIYSSDPYIQIEASEGKQTVKFEKKLLLSEALRSDFHYTLHPEGKAPVDITFKNYFKNAVEKMVENVPGGTNQVEIIYLEGGRRQTVLVGEGREVRLGNVTLSYNDTTRRDAIHMTVIGGRTTITSPHTMLRMRMNETVRDTIAPGTAVETDSHHYFHIGGISFMTGRFYVKAQKQIVPGNNEESSAAALFVDISHSGKTRELTIIGGPGYVSKFEETNIDGINIRVAYGDKKIPLPFSLYLNDFVLERYAGSKSPSSYSSLVTLNDQQRNLSERHSIFMNKVLDYRGYRFFQSSYDMDERGTILSVNHDAWGTGVTYAGYILLGLGFIFTLFNRNSRFLTVNSLVRDIRVRRKAGITVIIFILFGFTMPAKAQNPVRSPVSSEHAAQFGQLLVQTWDGRFEPVQTLAYDAMQKISRKTQFNMPGKGNMTALQAFMDIMMDGVYWQHQKIIYIREKSVRDILGVKGRYASLLDIYDQESKYKLARQSEISFRKKQSEQNAFDREIIKLDERINIFFSILNGSLLKLFPQQGSPGQLWLQPNDILAFRPLAGDVTFIRESLNLDEVTYSNLMSAYFRAASQAASSGDYSMPGKIAGIIGQLQRKDATPGLLPSVGKVNWEIFYNNAGIFIKLRNWYALLSVLMLILAFVDNVIRKKNRSYSIAFNALTVLLGIAFLYHSFGLGLRWYLSGHAPWSNGYEALLLMAWGSLLAGFSFFRYSKITLAATVLLAASMLMTASHSSYDPQLTNLQPVLKSYWLIIHVAVITVSYGFLGLGFVLGLINLFISLFKTRKNQARLSLLIREHTWINEMNLTVGLFLATMGTFLGGVWANESWGRYWGWDAKETWALIILLTYALLLHFRLVPKLKSAFAFNAGSVIAFGSVLMTFIGVNYYLSKGLHSYAADDTPVFPLWAWFMIFCILILIIVAGIKEKMLKETSPDQRL